MESLGTAIKYAAPVVGWLAGRLANNVLRIEMPPYISNQVIDKTAQLGQKYLGSIGYWIGKGVGTYLGVSAASNEQTLNAVQWAGSLLGTAVGFTTAAVMTHIGNRLKKINVSEETKQMLKYVVENLPEKIEDAEMIKIVDVIIDADKYIKNGSINQKLMEQLFENFGDKIDAKKV
jgi:hypothetical protein